MNYTIYKTGAGAKRYTWTQAEASQPVGPQRHARTLRAAIAACRRHSRQFGRVRCGIEMPA